MTTKPVQTFYHHPVFGYIILFFFPSLVAYTFSLLVDLQANYLNQFISAVHTILGI
jgi:hypothetical protein|tara:strand:+ start:402 stop:569 length:168 start_codon:yes stop_codon:yes gene_type:complete